MLRFTQSMIAAADVGIMDGREEGLGGRVWGQTLASLAGQYPSANSVENLRYGPNDLAQLSEHSVIGRIDQ